ncbi:ribonuclease Z [Pseudonocardia oroxyli]|uniref:Ribonuclease Z n=2 Tax=Pseudonocardiaceae TaxID=2070 RepID=A0A1G7N163_PSEOR|nr:ribonuclease Z [Pseudonocardia oroxyli]
MRELTVLGTASQAPTRTRHHNGYFLRWDAEGYLFDPGEGSQRQMLLAGIPASAITRLCLTHLHGDHCLGVPGVLQRISLDQVAHPVHAHFPASGHEYFRRLRYASSYLERGDIVEHPHAADGPVAPGLSVARLEHPVEAFGYRLTEPDGIRMLPDELARHGITGPRVREIQARGSLDGVDLARVSAPRPGQVFAFVMDTRLCEGVFALADRADMLVVESTFLHGEADLAHAYGHLTAREAATVARECGVRTLVLTHFSQRYTDPSAFVREAREVFDGELVVAEDLMRVPVPPRTAQRAPA